MLFGFLVVLIALLALLLVGVVLLQSGKGGGLAGIASTGTTQILGARQAPDVLEKATWVLGGLFILLCVLTSFTLDTSPAERSVVQEGNVQTAPATPTTPVVPPANPATPTN
jgi:preprotein translocase subunit SecG